MSDIVRSKYMVMGTAGHIDHGKTTLLKKLTGIDADRLKEEQERGITIDIGFAPWIIPPYFVGVIDVPGHEKFIKNMLAGTGGIDALLLVVAADESVMPQTREHLEIASLLGIPRGIVAISKTDMAEPDLVDLVEEEVRELVAGTFLENAPVIRTSGVTGQGLDRLEAAIRQIADGMEERDATGLPRLFVDRVFLMRGFGVVVTGTTFSGVFRKNDPVTVFPADRRTRIRNLQVYGQSTTEAGPGQRTAMNLLGLDPNDVSRGMTITRPGVFAPTTMFNARFHLLPSFGKKLKHRAPVHVYHGSAEMLGRIHLLGCPHLEPGEDAWVQIRLESPALIWPGDRFVVRQYSPLVTMGGGKVLETHPERSRKRLENHMIRRLGELNDAPPEKALLLLLDAGEQNGFTVAELVNRTGLAEERVQRILKHAAEEGRVVSLTDESGRWLAGRAVEQGRTAIRHELAAHFKANPFSPGIPKQELRTRCRKLEPDVFDFLLVLLEKEGELTTSSGRVTRPDSETALAPELEERLADLQRQMAAAGLEGVSREAVERTLSGSGTNTSSVMELLIHRQRLVRIHDDYFLDPATFEKLLHGLQGRLRRGQLFGVGDFKEWFGLTRKSAIPLLEYLDRKGFTLRVGNNRQWL
ncbi:MAG: selenocysteine-specific translation elongation factor [Acidobacteria bacterium]|nr:selenocysteine-specific translation elongation factor [Acidobacteriota bacterium]